MHFDRFDICAAYWHLYQLPFHSYMPYDCDTISRVQFKCIRKLQRLHYKPDLSDSNLATISENAKAIYMQLVRKYLGVHSTCSKG
jgi:hypothetical protein